jgi:hypothetical protein
VAELCWQPPVAPPNTTVPKHYFPEILRVVPSSVMSLEQPQTAESPTRRSPLLSRAIGSIPTKLRIAFAAVAVLLIALGIYAAFVSGASTLHILVHHNFREADLSVVIDGHVNFTEHLAGAAKKRLGLFEQVDGNFSKSLPLASGEHLVEVQLRSAADGVNQSRSSRIKIPDGKEATLSVSASRNSMNLNFQGASVAQDSSVSNLANNAVSLALTVMGSALTAAVGFFVQDFLRSKKAA